MMLTCKQPVLNRFFIRFSYKLETILYVYVYVQCKLLLF